MGYLQKVSIFQVEKDEDPDFMSHLSRPLDNWKLYWKKKIKKLFKKKINFKKDIKRKLKKYN